MINQRPHRKEGQGLHLSAIGTGWPRRDSWLRRQHEQFEPLSPRSLRSTTTGRASTSAPLMSRLYLPVFATCQRSPLAAWRHTSPDSAQVCSRTSHTWTTQLPISPRRARQPSATTRRRPNQRPRPLLARKLRVTVQRPLYLSRAVPRNLSFTHFQFALMFSLNLSYQPTSQSMKRCG